MACVWVYAEPHILLLCWVSVESNAEGECQTNQFKSPGDSSSSAIGSLYLNASLALLNEGPKKSHPIVFNL